MRNNPLQRIVFLSTALAAMLCIASAAAADNVFQKAIAKATPSVVTVTAGTQVVMGAGGPLRQPLVASGVILTEDGYIVSNASSLGRLQNLKVALKEGEAVEARLVKADRSLDLVILKVDRRGLSALPPYVDTKPQLGQWVIVIGNQFGLSESKNDPLSASVGVIAAVGPVQAAGFTYSEPVIQADLSINIGAFGGALIDIEGRLIGVAGRLLADSRTSTPLNFAIPAAAVKSLLDEAMNPQPEAKPEPATEPQVEPEPKPPQPGARPKPQPKPEPQPTLKRPGYLGAFILDETDSRTGATIYRVVPGAPAEAAGLHEGDLIIAVNGKEVTNGRECLKELDSLAPGDTARITVQRGREEVVFTVKLERAPTPVLR